MDRAPLEVVRRDKEWWVVDPNNEDVPEYGPYDTKKEAQECKKGVTNFWKYYEREDWW